MGHTLPVWFGRWSDAPPDPEEWTDERVLDFVSEEVSEERAELRTASSRNWWHLGLLDELLGPDACVQYFDVEVMVLRNDALVRARSELDQLATRLETDERFKRAWDAAVVADKEVPVTSDAPDELGGIDFCSFVKTLHDRMRRAESTTGALIFVAAQP